MMMTPMNRLVKIKWPRKRKEMVKNSLPWNPCKESWSWKSVHPSAYRWRYGYELKR